MLTKKGALTTDALGTLSSELFKNHKTLPPFIKTNPIFAPDNLTPLKVKKIFPSIGLSNFQEETNITRAASEIKKEGGYVWNMLQTISDECSKAKDLITLTSQKTQFLASREERMAAKARLNETAQIVNCLTFMAENCNPRSSAAFHPTNGIVGNNEGKTVLLLNANIVNAEGTRLHKKGLPIFRLYKQVRDKCLDHGLMPEDICALEDMITYKVFNSENVPNKKYSVVFSSTGSDGAWDILTMSMRGFKSCQRWQGEYPKCLIGSILSRFVGIIYLTSGVSAESHPDYGSLGSKMMRRCVVRYAYDNDTGSPCLVMDKMYPAEDEEAIKVFSEILSGKTKEYADKMKAKAPHLKELKVHYGPKLSSKTKHIYLPNETITSKISHRERSYQDTALRTKYELDANILSHSQTELEQSAVRINSSLTAFISKRMTSVVDLKTEHKLKRLFNNFRLSGSFTGISELFVNALLPFFVPPRPTNYLNVQHYMRDCLRGLFSQRRSVIFYGKGKIAATTASICSIEYDIDALSEFLIESIKEFVKSEMAAILARG